MDKYVQTDPTQEREFLQKLVDDKEFLQKLVNDKVIRADLVRKIMNLSKSVFLSIHRHGVRWYTNR